MKHTTKNHGKHNGRNSNEIVNLRREIIFEIYRKYGFSLNTTILMNELKQELPKHDICCPSTTTLQRDRNALKEKYNRTFSLKKRQGQLISHKKYIASPFEQLSDIIRYYFHQFRIKTENINFILPAIQLDLFETNLDTFLQNLDNSGLNDTDMVYVYIIFTKNGLSEFVCTAFKQKYQKILFTTSHDYCAEFALEYQDLREISSGMMKIITCQEF